MSVLSVANVWFESSGANRIDYVNSEIKISPTANVTSNLYVTNSVVASNVVASNVSVNGTKISSYMGGYKNKIINANFDIWQRGTSNGLSGIYTADRWASGNVGTTKIASRQTFTVGQTDVPGNPKYYFRTVVTSSAGASNYCKQTQRVEGVDTLSGQVATLSFWAKADSSKNIGVEYLQYFGSGGSPSSSVSTPLGLVALTSSWQKFLLTTTIPSISGKTLGSDINNCLDVNFWLDAGSTYATRASSVGQQSGTFDISRVQLEEGPVATEFESRHIQQELALCQRYYFKDQSSAAGFRFMSGTNSATTNSMFRYPFRIPMRTTPTMYTTGTASDYTISSAGANTNCSSVPGQGAGNELGVNIDASVSSGLTTGYGSYLRAAGTAAYLAFDAEL